MDGVIEMCKKEYINYQTGEKLEENRLIELPSNNLLVKFPKYWVEWDFDKNSELGLDIWKITFGSNKNAHWIDSKGHTWESRISSRTYYDYGCPYCTNQKTLIGFNDIHTTNKRLSDALVNYEDGFKYTDGSNVKVKIKCPDCKSYIGMRKISDLKKYGISCSKCSDGISYPERFVSNLLSELNIEYLYNKKLEWIKDRYYDFYIPSMNMIIETHGKQHENGGFKSLGAKNYDEEKENDIYKKKKALDNGIEYYIELDCSISEVNYIKNSIMNSILPTKLDINNIDWCEINRKSLKSLVITISKEFNDTDITVKELASKYKLDTKTIYSYLKKGNDIGITRFTQDKQKNNEICYAHNFKAVVVLDLNGKYLSSYNSIKEALMDLNIYNENKTSSVGRCCKGYLKTAYGYKWMYKEDYEKLG